MRWPRTLSLALSPAPGSVVGGMNRSAAVAGSPRYGTADHSDCLATPSSLSTQRTSMSWNITALGCSPRTMEIQLV